jgi:hypothetical protein
VRYISNIASSSGLRDKFVDQLKDFTLEKKTATWKTTVAIAYLVHKAPYVFPIVKDSGSDFQISSR